MSAAIGSTARSDDEVGPEATAVAPAAVPSEESSSLSPASRVLAMADKVADDEDGSGASSEDGSDDSIGPVSRSRRTMSPGDPAEGGPRQRRRGFVQERRGKHKQSALRRPIVDSPLESPERRASSNDSWRQAIFGDRRSSPESAVGEQGDGHGSAAAGRASTASSEEASLRRSPEIVEQGEACHDVDEKAVERMDVKDLKATAVELGIPTGGRKSQLRDRIKQKLSVSCRLSDGGGGAAAASAVPAGHDDPAAAVGKTVGPACAAASAAAEDVTVIVAAAAGGASVAQSPPAAGTVLAADGSRSSWPEEPSGNARAAADVPASPEGSAADSVREAAGESENIPPALGLKILEPLRPTKQAAAGGGKAPGVEGTTAGEDSVRAEISEDSRAFSPPPPLCEEVPGEATPAAVAAAAGGTAAGSARPSAAALGEAGVAAAASAAVVAVSAEVAGGGEDVAAAGRSAGAVADDGSPGVEGTAAGGVDGGGGGPALTEVAGAAGRTDGSRPDAEVRRVDAICGGPAGAPGLEASEPSKTRRQGAQQHRPQHQQGQGQDTDASGEVAWSIPVVGPAPAAAPAILAAPAPAGASGTEGHGSEDKTLSPNSAVAEATEEVGIGGGSGGDTAAAVVPEPPAASATIAGTVFSVRSSFGDGASSSATKVRPEARFSVLESDDDRGSSPDSGAREGGREGGRGRKRHALEGADGILAAEHAAGMKGEGEVRGGARGRPAGEEADPRGGAVEEKAGARMPREGRAHREAAWEREPGGGHGERRGLPRSAQDGPADGGRSDRRFPEPGRAESASRGSELVPVVLFSVAVDAVEEEEEEEEGEDQEGEEKEEARSRAGDRRSWGAEERVEREQEAVPFVVLSAEALTQKFLEVALLWGPILRNTGPSSGGCWSGVDSVDTKTTYPLLPETEALKAKAKVLSAWFHRDADPAARDIAADLTQKTTRDTEGVQKSAAPVEHGVRPGASAGPTTAVVRKRSVGGVDAEDGDTTLTASTASVQHRATRAAAPPAPSVAPTSAGDVRAGESGGGSATVERGGKGRRGSLRRLSVSPPRTKLTAAAAAARVSAGSRLSRRSMAPAAHRGAAAKEPSRGGSRADAASTAATASVAPQPARKRNPLIRDLSPPRPSRTSVSRSSSVAAARRGVNGRETADVKGVARRHVSAARRRRGMSVDRPTATAGEARLKGTLETPARTRESRSRKASLTAGHRSNTPRTGSDNTRGGNGKAATGRDLDPCGTTGTPTGIVAPGSGGRSALQVFGFDPTVSKPPREDTTMRVGGTQEADARAT